MSFKPLGFDPFQEEAQAGGGEGNGQFLPLGFDPFEEEAGDGVLPALSRVARKAPGSLGQFLGGAAQFAGERLQNLATLAQGDIMGVTPEEEKDTAAYRVVKGAGEQLSAAGAGLADVSEQRIERINREKPERLQQRLWDDPSLLASPSWLVENAGDTAVSMVPTLAAHAMGGGLASGLVGGGMEGAFLYRELAGEGVPEDRAAVAATAYGAVSGALNAIAAGKVLEQAEGKGLAKKLAKWAAAGGTEALTEYAEEPAQAGIGAVARGKGAADVASDVAESLKNVDVIPGAFITGAGGSALGDVKLRKARAGGAAEAEPNSGPPQAPGGGAEEATKGAPQERAAAQAPETAPAAEPSGLDADVEEVLAAMTPEDWAAMEAAPEDGAGGQTEDSRESEPAFRPIPDAELDSQGEEAAEENSPRAPRFESEVDAARAWLAEAGKGPVDLSSPEVHERILSTAVDSVSGFTDARTGRSRQRTIERAQDFVDANDGQQAHYAEIDLKNLGGLNAAMGASAANGVYRRVADAIREELGALGDHVSLFRHGGDEMSAVVVGAADSASIEQALARANERVRAWSASETTSADAPMPGIKLADIPHPKHKGDLSRRGIGITFGTSRIRPGASLDRIIGGADMALEVQKKVGQNEYQGQAGQTGAVPLGGQARGAAQGIDQAPEGKRGANDDGPRSPRQAQGEPSQGLTPPAPATSPSLEGAPYKRLVEIAREAGVKAPGRLPKAKLLEAIRQALESKGLVAKPADRQAAGQTSTSQPETNLVRKTTAADQAAAMSVDDIMSMWDQEATKAEPVAPSAGEKLKSASERLKSAAARFKEINAILGEEGHLSSAPVDEERWRKIKPLLKASWDDVVAAGKDLAEFVKIALDNLSPKGRPYFERFVREEIKGEKPSTPREESSANRQDGEPGRASLLEGETGVPEGKEAGPADGKAAVRPERTPVGTGSNDSHSDGGQRPGAEGGGEPGGGAGGGPGVLVSKRGDGRRGRSKVTEAAGDESSARLAERDSKKKNGRNLVIGAEDVVVPNGNVSRIKANIAAIRLLKDLQAQGRQATPEEQRVLMQFSGWGSAAEVVFKDRFDQAAKAVGVGRNPYLYGRDEADFREWREKYGNALHPALGGLLTEEEWGAAKDSTLNAHYTDRRVVSAMWDMVRRLGFKGGRIVEPSAGSGLFFGLMPDAYRRNSDLAAVELDPITGAILGQLYPDADVQVTGFEKARRMGDNSADLVISNVPFGDYPVNDPNRPQYAKLSIHNYFISRSLDLVRPGGLVAAITTHYTLDGGAAGRVREEWARKADLVAAVRLPGGAFEKNAGTAVTTDVLLFRKKDETPFQGEPFRHLAPVETPEGKTQINEYFLAHPEMALGEHSMAGKMYGGLEYTLKPRAGEDMVEALGRAATSLPKGVVGAQAAKPPQERATAGAAELGQRDGALVVKDGKPYMVEDGQLVAPDWTKEKAAQALSYAKLKAALLAHLDAMGRPETTDAAIKAGQSSLGSLYDAHVAKYGPVNARGHAFLSEDLEFPAVAALESVVEETEEQTIKSGPHKGQTALVKTIRYKKADVFAKRTVEPFREPERAESVADAMKISRVYRGVIDLGYVASLAGTTPEVARGELLASGDVFENPATGLLEPKDLYLSGNVREKLKRAETAAQDSPQYERNVEALREVMPRRLGVDEISFRLGSSWVPTEVVNAFMEHVGIRRAKATFSRVQAGESGQSEWHVDFSDLAPEARNKWGVDGAHAADIIAEALNLRRIEVKDPESDGSGKVKWVKNPEKTAAAQTKQRELQEEFRRFVREHRDLGPVVEEVYNERFNNYVPRSFEVPPVKHFPGASTAIELRPNQKVAVVRGLQESTLMAHGVGSGKTFEIISTAMEMRRLGTAKKPWIVVQGSTLAQFAASFKKLYPQARILVPSEKQREAANRRRLLSQVATGDWDAVITPHSFFNQIAVSPEREETAILEELAEVEAALREENVDPTAEGKRGESPKVKHLRKVLKRRKTRLEELASLPRDKALYFDHLGVDALLIDEAHAYKRGDFFTKMDNVKGLDRDSSKRSFQMLMKARVIQEKTGGKNVNLYTGTPISNTITEMWTMFRYARPDLLREFGVEQFDDFASTFCETTVSQEETSTGDFKEIERFNKYVNGPELLTMWRMGADVALTENLDYIKGLPKIQGGKPREVVVQRSEALTNFIRNLKAERDAWDNLPGKQKREQSHVPLVIFGEAKKAAIDLRLVDPGLPDAPESKINEAVRNILDRYHKTRAQKATQIVFSDTYQSSLKAGKDGSGKTIKAARVFNLYQDIKKKLIAGGISADQIAIINDYANDEKRAKLFDKVNAGDIAVVIGSTERLGVGTNVQERLLTAHHIDVPIRPMDFEQRNGRIRRPGNMHPEVEILVYGTKNTLDSVRFQILLSKQKFINQLLRGEVQERTFENPFDEVQQTFEDMMAAFSGNPLAKEKMTLTNDVRRLEMLQSAHKARLSSMRYEIRDEERNVEKLKERLEAAKAEAERLKAAVPDGKLETLTLGKSLERKEAARELDDWIETQGQRIDAAMEGMTLGKWRATDQAALARRRMVETPAGKYEIVIAPAVYDKDGGIDYVGPKTTYKEADGPLAYAKDFSGAQGLIRRLENEIQGRVNEPDRLRGLSDRALKNLASLREEIAKPFAQDGELKKARGRLAEVERALASQENEDLAAVKDQRADGGEEGRLRFSLSPAQHDGGILPAEKINAHLTPILRRWRNAPAVRVVQSESLLPQWIRGEIEMAGYEGRVDALFDRAGQAVWIVADKFDSLSQVERKLFHEAYGHYGLRGLLGRKADPVLLQAFVKHRRGLIQQIADQYGYDLSTRLGRLQAAEEVLAHLAETHTEPGLVRRAIAAIRQWLRDMGFSLELTDNDIRALIARSARWVEDGGAAGAGQESRAPAAPVAFVQASLEDGQAGGRSPAFSTPETEARYREARKGLADQRGLAKRVQDWSREIARGFSRHYLHLPSTPEFAKAHEALRQLEAAPQAAKEEAVRALERVTRGLTPAQYDLFSRKVILDDLAFEAERGHELPFGFTPETLEQDQATVDAAVDAAPKIRDALAARKKLIDSVTSKLVAGGILTEEQVQNPAYFRHQVLDYARARQFAQGSGKALKQPRPGYAKRREGSSLDINANYLEAEFEFLHRAMVDLKTVEALGKIRREYDRKADVKDLARQANDAALKALILAEQEGNPLAPSATDERLQAFRKGIAMGFSRARDALRKAGHGGLNIPDRYRSALSALLAPRQDVEDGQAAPVRGDVLGLLKHLLDKGLPGADGAAQVFKAIQGRQRFVEQTLGENFKTWRDVVPAGYALWQPEKGNVFFTGRSIGEKAMDRLMDLASSEVIPGVDAGALADVLKGVRKALMVGGRKTELVLPEALATTLDNLRPAANDGLFDKVFSAPLGWWKRWVLINPRRFLKYNLNNLSGDLDATIAGNPRALKRLPQAVRELYDVMRGGEPTRRYLEAAERGVFDSGLSIQEIPDINALSRFQLLKAKRSRMPTQYAIRIWRAMSDYTQFRENWLRYAAYLDYVTRLEAGETPKSIGYGASDQAMVDALTDPRDRAALMARDLLGDYGAVSHYGQSIRRKLIPFYSWMEINTKRYLRLIANAYAQGLGQGLATSATVGALAGKGAVMAGARMSAWLGLRMFLLYGLIQAWNNLVHPDEEDDLPADERARLHLTLGRAPNGEIIRLRLQGALSDFLGWIGLEDAASSLVEISKGRAGIGDLLLSMAKAPVNKIAGGVTPLIKTPVELATGKRFYPDVFNPRSSRDGVRGAFRLWSLENEYDWLTGKPSRGYLRSWVESAASVRNPGEESYDAIRDLVARYRERKGIEGGGDVSTPRSRAVREYKQALRYGDQGAAKAALDRLHEMGLGEREVTDSVLRAAPVSGLSQADRESFLAELSPQEKAKLGRAEGWYAETFLDADQAALHRFRDARAGVTADRERYKALVEAGRQEEARRLSAERKLNRRTALLKEAESILRGLEQERKAVEDGNSSAEIKQARIARIKERARRTMEKMLRNGG